VQRQVQGFDLLAKLMEIWFVHRPSTNPAIEERDGFSWY
jgi:hypothetical protein